VRYCKFEANGVARYALVEVRDGELWAVKAMAAPEEDATANAPKGARFAPQPLKTMKLLAPVRPSKIVCVGRNYKEHAAELGSDVPKEPLLFLKAPSALLALGGTIRRPAQSQRVDFEGELGIVIGKRCYQIGKDEDVRQYIRGYTCVNDVTARDLQKSDGQWSRAKGFDTFCPVGPIVTDEVDPIQNALTVTTTLNGETKQSGSTGEMIFPVAELLRYITAAMTLEPGDLIPTGTPAGVGPMQAGDVVRVAVEGIGSLENPVS
jgi:2-keto-4-pentenoate hydratase/2-oxohepta-3-ene-1,7-dioic acid hydratase in catechol pathway